MPNARPTEMTASLGGWTFDIRDGWISGKSTPPSLVSPSGNGVIQMSFYTVNQEITPAFVTLVARSALEEGGAHDPTVGDPLNVRSGEVFVGGRGSAADFFMTVMACGKGKSAVLMTYIHTRDDDQEQADAEATMLSARVNEPADRGRLGRLFGRH